MPPRTLRVLFWNSRGAGVNANNGECRNWNKMRRQLQRQRVNYDATLGLLIESGLNEETAERRQISINTVYGPPSPTADVVEYNVPWCKTVLSPQASFRCSFGMILMRSLIFRWQKPRICNEISRKDYIRGFAHVTLHDGNVARLAVVQVHLHSRSEPLAASHLGTVINLSTKQVGQFTPIIIVGDFNIDVSGDGVALPEGWHLCNLGRPTHEGGKELDYAVYNDTNLNPEIDQVFNYINLDSDHSMLGLTLEIRR